MKSTQKVPVATKPQSAMLVRIYWEGLSLRSRTTSNEYGSSVCTILALVIVSLFSGISLRAEEFTQAAQSQVQPQPDKNSRYNWMMDPMTMDAMIGIRSECIEKQNDGKMCDQECMEMCQKKLSKSECQKMMRQVRAQMKIEKNK